MKGEKKRRGRGRRRTEEQKEEDQAKRYGTLDFCMETNLDYGFYEIWYGSYGICMIIISPQPRVLLGFHLNPKIMESKVGKTPYGTRWLWYPPFVVGFMVK